MIPVDEDDVTVQFKVTPSCAFKAMAEETHPMSSKLLDMGNVKLFSHMIQSE